MILYAKFTPRQLPTAGLGGRKYQIVGCNENSGWALEIKNQNMLYFSVWNNDIGVYESFQIGNARLYSNLIYNTLIIYDGSSVKGYLKTSGMSYASASKTSSSFNSILTQENWIPTMIGNNPSGESSVDTSNYYDFKGAVYNVKLWYNIGGWYNSQNADEINSILLN